MKIKSNVHRSFRKIVAVMLSILLVAFYIPTICAGASTVTVSTSSDLQMLSDKVTKSGVYTVRITDGNNEYDLTDSEVTVFDDLGMEIAYNEKTMGWPLLEGVTYTVSCNSEEDYTSSTCSLVKRSQPIFPDTDENGWYYDAVVFSSGYGLVTGYSNGNFGTANGIQRQDYLLILARAAGADLDMYAEMRCPFSDVAPGSYYEAAVVWGYENGVTTGYENGMFGVGDLINREQIVTMLMRYLGVTDMDPDLFYELEQPVKSQYTDYYKVSDYAKESVVLALYVGFINGKNETTIDPAGTAQRCEVAQIMYNIYNIGRSQM